MNCVQKVVSNSPFPRNKGRGGSSQGKCYTFELIHQIHNCSGPFCERFLDELEVPIEAQKLGSPADKADLEVGDEILEVNGRSLEDATHTEVISHIHQCIRSRTICLRVKRRTGNKLGSNSHLNLSSSVNEGTRVETEAVLATPTPYIFNCRQSSMRVPGTKSTQLSVRGAGGMLPVHWGWSFTVNVVLHSC
ncbi:Na(+)/H(+) exchange regulatory cofactor NHE-RF1 [Orchesella cincta]|uniref:Na(+)/H(+) exchange regulatory cofactor NHE-RF1 n=1 Tax=Orchesella cincta TaxID=48709 RepID=A0A1D2NN22_ORCCI|nr:Na(+)/H(+) exchange regulatory cofactor NHE-RF1 [Orchesella cincta]